MRHSAGRRSSFLLLFHRLIITGAFSAVPKTTFISHHGGTWDSQAGKPHEKASWESLEGKPQIPLSTRSEGRHCCYSSGGMLTCMPPLETRTDSTGETPEVPQDPCQHWRGNLRYGTDSTQGLRPRYRRERNPERPPSNSHGDWPFLRPPERVPDIPVVSREHLPQLEKIQEVLAPGEMRPISAEASRG